MLGLIGGEEGWMRTPQRKRTGRRIVLALIGVVIVGVLAAGGWFVYQQRNAPKTPTSKSTSTTAITAPTLPVPSAARSTYTNSAYGYTVQYPTQWNLVANNDESGVQVFIVQSTSVPEGMGFDIWCHANPTNMSAQQWRQSEISTYLKETAVGNVTLSSGVQAYEARGQTSGEYVIFVTVHAGKACDLTEYVADPTNTKIIEASINSFTWN